MKFLPLLLIGVVLVSGCSYLPDIPGITGSTVIDLPGPDSIYSKYNPAEHLEGWELTYETKRLSEMPTDIRKSMIEQTTDDAAFWEYKKGKETIRIWARHLEDPDAFYDTQLNNYISPALWRSQTILLYADVGLTGVRKILSSDDPLMLYVSQGQDMVYMYYYNDELDGVPVYADAIQSKDQKFLIELSKDIIGYENNVVEDAPEIE